MTPPFFAHRHPMGHGHSRSLHRLWCSRHRAELHGRAGPHGARTLSSGAKPSPRPSVDPRATVPAHVLSRLFLLVILVLWLGTNWLAPLDCHSQPMAFTFRSVETGAIVPSPGKSCTSGQSRIDRHR
jgi:hypothetical protein